MREQARLWLMVAIVSGSLLTAPACGPEPETNQAAARQTISDDELIRRFHVLYYSRKPYINSYLGIETAQYPTDNWMMQEIITGIKPDFLIETGTLTGGTSLFYADILEKVHPQGKVITVDIVDKTQQAAQFRNWRDRVTFILGSSVDPNVVDRIRRTVAGAKTVMVTLDSDHRKEHVSRELAAYAPLVTLNSYLVVQDTHLNGHPVYHVSAPGEGPAEAVAAFLATTDDFVADRGWERHLITQYPGGYLKRVKVTTSDAAH